MKKIFAIILLICFVLKNLLVFSMDSLQENYLYYFDADWNWKIDNIQIDFNRELTWSLNFEKIFFSSNTWWLSLQKIDRVSWNDFIENTYLSWNILWIKIVEQDNYLTWLIINNGTSSHLRIRTNNWIWITDLDWNEIVFSFTTSFNNYKNAKYWFIFNNFDNWGSDNWVDDLTEQDNEQNSWSWVSQNEENNSDEDNEIIEEESVWENDSGQEDLVDEVGEGEESIWENNQEIIDKENSNDLQNENEDENNSEEYLQSWSHTSGWVSETEENNLTEFPYKVSLFFQSPSYLLEKVDEEKNYNCDTSKTDCKANFNLNIDEWSWFKTIWTKYICEWDFWLLKKTWEENKCNPNTIVYPAWSFETTFKVYEKSNTWVYFQNKIFIKNEWYKTENTTKTVYISTYSTPSYVENINIEIPKISVQSWLDENNNCKKTDCNLNLIYEPKNSKEECLWSFPWWIFSDWNANNCNPSYVKYWIWDFKVTLRVYQKWNESNYKESYFYFSNKKIAKDAGKAENNYEKIDFISLKSIIILQWTLWKNKTLSWNILTCFWETCNVNFDWSQSEWKDIFYDWNFWDWETFSWKNPPSKTYEKWNYKISLKIYDDNWNEDISYFYINVFSDEKEFIKSSIEKDEKIDISKYNLKISKIFPNPVWADNFEFIEVKNLSDEDVNLFWCSLDNEIWKWSKEFLIKENIILKPSETRKFYKFETKINIRNSWYEEVNLTCFNNLLDKKSWDFSVPEWFIVDENISLENIKEVKKDKENWNFNIIYKNDKSEKIKQDEKLNIFENVLKNNLSKEEKVEKITSIINETFTQKISKQKSWIKISWVSVPNETLFLKFNQNNDLGFLNLLFPKTYADDDIFEAKTDNFWVYEFFIDKPNVWEFEIKNYLKIWDDLLEIEKNNILEVDDEYLDYIKSDEKEKKAENFVMPKSVITLQWVLGKKKIVWNKIVCEWVSECSINLDWRKSLGKKLSYFWDFWNWKTFEKSNPASYKFRSWEYMISLTVKSWDYKDISYFFIEVIPKEKDETEEESKNIFIPKANASSDDDVVSISVEKHILYSFLVFVLFLFLWFIVLRKKGII